MVLNGLMRSVAAALVLEWRDKALSDLCSGFCGGKSSHTALKHMPSVLETSTGPRKSVDLRRVHRDKVIYIDDPFLWPWLSVTLFSFLASSTNKFL